MCKEKKKAEVLLCTLSRCKVTLLVREEGNRGHLLLIRQLKHALFIILKNSGKKRSGLHG